jgi:hypothetical protein
MRATKAILLSSLLSVSVAAWSDSSIERGKLVYFCDKIHSAVLLDLGKQDTALKIPGYETNVVNWDDLLILKQRENSSFKDSSRVDSRYCGQVDVRIESGYVNSDPNGQSGADDFPVVELRMGDRTILPRTGLQVCEQGDRMESYFFGKCPDAWASFIKTKEQPDGGLQISVTRKYLTPDDSEKQVSSSISIQ